VGLGGLILNVTVTGYTTSKQIDNTKHTLQFRESHFTSMGDMIVKVTKTGSPIGMALSGWFFGGYRNQDILTNVQINDEISYSIDKLGTWQK
jgi:hypothetical protein